MRRIRGPRVEAGHTISHSPDHRSDGHPVTRRHRPSTRLRRPRQIGAPDRFRDSHDHPTPQRDSMADTTLTPKSVRIAEDEAKWLSAAATKGAVTQNDLIRLAVHRLRKDLGAA